MKCRAENRKEIILNHIANNIPLGKLKDKYYLKSEE